MYISSSLLPIRRCIGLLPFSTSSMYTSSWLPLYRRYICLLGCPFIVVVSVFPRSIFRCICLLHSFLFVDACVFFPTHIIRCVFLLECLTIANVYVLFPGFLSSMYMSSWSAKNRRYIFSSWTAIHLRCACLRRLLRIVVVHTMDDVFFVIDISIVDVHVLFIGAHLRFICLHNSLRSSNYISTLSSLRRYICCPWRLVTIYLYLPWTSCLLHTSSMYLLTVTALFVPRSTTLNTFISIY